MPNEDKPAKPADSGSTETKPKRERRFPIRQFSMLLDQFLKAHSDVGESVEDLSDAVDTALLEHYKTANH